MTTAELTTTPASRLRFRLLAVVLSVLAAVAVWAIVSLSGARLTVSSPLVEALTIDLPLVIVTALPVALAGWGLLALLERVTARARRTWTIVAVAVLVLSIPPLAFLDASWPTQISLALMHVAVGLTLILMLRRSAHDGH